jgi:hypothetical protein
VHLTGSEIKHIYINIIVTKNPLKNDSLTNKSYIINKKLPSLKLAIFKCSQSYPLLENIKNTNICIIIISVNFGNYFDSYS